MGTHEYYLISCEDNETIDKTKCQTIKEAEEIFDSRNEIKGQSVCIAKVERWLN